MSMSSRQTDQDYFRTLMMAVVGQAYMAADYALAETPIQWTGGKYQWSKPLDEGFYAIIEYQVLVYTPTEYATRMPSRFRVNLIRTNQVGGRASQHPRYAQRLLSALVVTDFGVAILPHAEHWWEFRDTHSLGQSLAEAGHLSIGYGMPWLTGDLTPPTN